jgi:apolipoprotein N-acyltransferase
MIGEHALRKRCVLLLVAIWLAGFGLKQIEWTQPSGTALEVSLLQGNIPQQLKWREDQLVSSLETYRRLVDESASRLIILPETAFPLFYHHVPTIYLEKFTAHAMKNGGDLLIGLPERTDKDHYYNSVLSFGSSPTQTYRKSHLVPFGEFIPLRPVFGWLLDVLQIPLLDFSRGSLEQRPLNVAGQQVAVNICYEDAFGEEVIRQLPQATLLVNFSNDAWFGNSIAPIQHLQISQMRALEAGRYMLRATNTGVTAVINPRGEVLSQLPLFTTGSLEHEVWGYGGATPYVRWGNYAVLLLCVLAIAANLMLSRRLLSQAQQNQ